MPPIDLSGPIIQPPANPLDAFDPNDRDKGTPPWATYSPGRRPNFKVHKVRGHALSALRNYGRYSGAVIYERVGDRWEERGRFNPSRFRPSKCESCQQTTMQPATRWDYHQRQHIPTGRMENTGRYAFVRERGKIADPLRVVFVCYECQRSDPAFR